MVRLNSECRKEPVRDYGFMKIPFISVTIAQPRCVSHPHLESGVPVDMYLLHNLHA